MLIKCPNCGKVYEPVLKPVPGMGDHMTKGNSPLVQDIYPDAEPWQREQLISGICSDGCWEEFLGEALEEAAGESNV